ncbi:hypothetical protein E2C01_024581 [Portunus trituberculatus]|uniref:Secreted protein n=1 Tax=Portunus trituberculatus TaxID=210409 RepID=A0A5B7EDJ2_PORTR|nr:hypothetical protein [Portunus trituberculatus]
MPIPILCLAPSFSTLFLCPLIPAATPRLPHLATLAISPANTLLTLLSDKESHLQYTSTAEWLCDTIFTSTWESVLRHLIHYHEYH